MLSPRASIRNVWNGFRAENLTAKRSAKSCSMSLPSLLSILMTSFSMGRSIGIDQSIYTGAQNKHIYWDVEQRRWRYTVKKL